MSRASISTGQFSLDRAADKKQSDNRASGDESCHLLFIANFSGSQNSSLDSKRPIEIDRDNFDDVFESMKVTLDTPLTDSPLRFAELDEMHPDFLFENVDIFNRFRALKKKLKSPQTFEAAATEIYQWHDQVANQVKSNATTKSESAGPDSSGEGSLLDSILGNDSGSEASSGINIQSLVKDIVAPYVTPKPDPQQKELLATVDQAASQLMRKLMHSVRFKTLESAWRSLYLLVRRIETDSKLKLFILDANSQSVQADLLSEDETHKSKLQKIIVDERSSVGATGFSTVMLDEIFGTSLEGLNALDKLGQITAQAGAILLSGGSEQLAGCESLGATPDKDDWSFSLPSDIDSKWQELRQSPIAGSMALVAPRFLCRMPFGKKTAPVETFGFEELPENNKHEFYLWSNGAWLVALVMAQNFSISGDINDAQVHEIERLPLHVFDDDGESVVTPCAEINMLDSAAEALNESGLMALRSILNKDSLLVPKLKSLKS